MCLQIRHTLMVTLLLGVSLSALAANGEGPGKKKGGLNQDGGGIQFILSHKTDLNLDASQLSQLNDLNNKIETQREKLKQDPEIRDLFREMHDAQESGDQQAVRPARKKLREAMEKKSGLKFDEVIKQVRQILHPDQLKKLAALRDANGMDGNPMKSLREQKAAEKADEQTAADHKPADSSKAPPSLYDDN